MRTVEAAKMKKARSTSIESAWEARLNALSMRSIVGLNRPVGLVVGGCI